jgi:hypothetical protein
VQDLLHLGPRTLELDLIVISTVLLFGYWLGTRVFGLDSDTALLVSAGSGICGAAAVLATDRVIDSESHEVGVAIATVVVFGTVAMFLYPVIYPVTGFTERQFGIYTGTTVYEVAQALAAGRAISAAAGDTAVITKMLRVVVACSGACHHQQLAAAWFHRNQTAHQIPVVRAVVRGSDPGAIHRYGAERSPRPSDRSGHCAALRRLASYPATRLNTIHLPTLEESKLTNIVIGRTLLK